MNTKYIITNSFRCFSTITLFVFLPFFGITQQYNFKNYSVENGLPYVQIFTMFQDSKGYLWSGGYGGLSKFNGKTFQNYSPKNGLANHYVNTIAENQQNEILVGTIDGLSVISKNKITNYSIKNGLPSKHITSICLDNEGIAWIGTTNGLCYLKDNILYQFLFFSFKHINCIYFTPQYGLWIGTNDGLYNIDKDEKNAYDVKNNLINTSITCITQNPISKELFIGTKNGMSVVNLTTKKHINYHVSNGLIDENVDAITCSENGTIWIGSKSGLVSFDGKEFSYFSIRSDNNSNHVSSLLIDYEQNLWIGTHNGLYKYRGKGFASYGKQDGLGGAFIYQIIADKDKNIWITTENNGVYKYAEGFFKNYSEKDGILDNYTQCAVEDDGGTLWFGSYKGISKLKNGKIENIIYGHDFKLEAPINCLYKDKKGNIWVGGHNGLCCITKQQSSYTTTYYKLPVSKKEYEVWSIKEDRQGEIWAGTYLAGLYKLVNGKFQNQAIILKTPIESALEIDTDHFNNIYVATLNGILIINTLTNKTKIISEKDGLISELVYSLKVSKDQKYLWAGTNQGISRINISKLTSGIIDITSYSKTDGFEGVECNTHGIYEDDKNNLWFGTVNGLIKYTPSEFTTNTNLPKTCISNIKLSYNDTLLADSSSLPYQLNNISFYFDGICLTNPDKVLYTYKLEGFDKDWSPSNDINFAKYDNLPSGKFTFKVKSCNNEGLWNLEPITFTFEIKTPYYKTWWFISLLIIATTGFIAVIFRYRLNEQTKKQQEKFEQEVEVSKAELKALRAQMNPHFVFNSLNSIQHYILNSKSEEAVKYLNKFAKLIRIILNNSDKPMVTINEDLESLKLYLELEQMRFDNKFDYTIVLDKSIDGDYDEIPPMLIQPYLENAILHGINPKQDKGHIDIKIKLVNQFIKISVIDDGIGRDASIAIQSLQPSARHKSLGMKITKDRVRILNSMHQSNLNVNIIDLYNQSGATGTQVDIFIPYIK